MVYARQTDFISPCVDPYMVETAANERIPSARSAPAIELISFVEIPARVQSYPNVRSKLSDGPSDFGIQIDSPAL